MTAQNYKWHRLILMVSALFFLGGCAASRPMVNSGGRSGDELEMLEDQSREIISDFKKAQQNVEAKVVPGDEIIVEVWLKDKLTQFEGFPLKKTVPDSGDDFVPHLGIVNVKEKTSSDLQFMLAEHFGRMLNAPTVIVECRQKELPWRAETFQAVRHVVVMGWVAKPGIYQFEQGLSLRNAIANAGDIKDFGNWKKIYVVRGSSENPEVLKVNLAVALTGKDVTQNILLQPSDAIYVPPIKMWKAYNFFRTLLLPIRAVRDTIFYIP